MKISVPSLFEKLNKVKFKGGGKINLSVLSKLVKNTDIEIGDNDNFVPIKKLSLYTTSKNITQTADGNYYIVIPKKEIPKYCLNINGNIEEPVIANDMYDRNYTSYIGFCNAYVYGNRVYYSRFHIANLVHEDIEDNVAIIFNDLGEASSVIEVGFYSFDYTIYKKIND